MIARRRRGGTGHERARRGNPDIRERAPARRRSRFAWLRRRAISRCASALIFAGLARAVSLGRRRGARSLFRRNLVRADRARVPQDRRDAASGASPARQAPDRRRDADVRRRSPGLARDERAVRLADAGGGADLVVRAAARSRSQALWASAITLFDSVLYVQARIAMLDIFLMAFCAFALAFFTLSLKERQSPQQIVRLRDADGRQPRPGERVQVVGPVPARRRRRRAPAHRASQALARALRRPQARRISSRPTPGRR